MKAKEFIFEGRDAPLYHFTTVEGLQSILASDTLKGRQMMNRVSGEINKQPTISFTRDYLRDFVPGRITSQSVGIRVDQSQLAQSFKMQAAVQKQLPDLEKFEKSLSPGYQAEIAKMRQTGVYNSGMSVNGVSLADIAKKTAAQQNRWESEERIVAGAIPNFSQYITGFVIPGKRSKDLATSMPADSLDLVLDSAIKLGVPVIWQRKEYDPAQLKQQLTGSAR